MKQIIVDILPDGTVKIEGVGFTDGTCQKYIDELIKALSGEVLDQKNKPEFYRGTTKISPEVKQSG